MRLHTRVRRGLAASALTMAGVMGLAGTAWAVPANDNRANAQVLTLGGTVAGTTVDATTEADETVVNCFADGNGGTTVWYSVTTSASDMDLRLVLSSATDQGVALWDSSGTMMIDCRDSQAGGQDEVLTANVTPSTTYLVSVDRYIPGNEGPFQLTATETAPPAPGAAVYSSPQILAFGPVPVGTQSPDQQFMLANDGASPVEVTAVGVVGDFEEFPISNSDCPSPGANVFAVPPGGCSFTALYAPNAAGPSSLEITWQYQGSEGPQQFTTTLTGEGVDEQPPPEVPEVPMTLLLPGSTLLLGAGVYLVRRRSRSAALIQG